MNMMGIEIIQGLITGGVQSNLPPFFCYKKQLAFGWGQGVDAKPLKLFCPCSCIHTQENYRIYSMNMKVDQPSSAIQQNYNWKKLADDYPAFVQPDAIHVYFEVHPPVLTPR